MTIGQSLKKFKRFTQIEKEEITQLYVYSLFSGLLSLVLPIGIQSIINFIQTGRTSTSWLIVIVIVVISIALNGLMQLMQLRITENLQQKIFVWSSMEMSYRFRFLDHQKNGVHYPPELANRFFDTLVIQKGLAKILIDIPTALLQILFGVILLSFYHPFFIGFSLLLLVFLFFGLIVSSRNALESSLAESKSKYKTAHWIQEVARAAASFEGSGSSTFSLLKNDYYATGYVHAREKHFSVLWRQYSYLILFKITIALCLLLIGGLLVINQQMTIGQFIASEIIILLIISSVEKLILSLSTMYDVLTSTEKIAEISELYLKDENTGSKLADFIPFQTEIKLNNISFSSPYLGREILHDSSLTVRPGEKLAIVSDSQLSSQTLIKLLQFHFTPTTGNVYLNDIPSFHFELNTVKKHIGSFQSSDTIFYGTFLDNILIGREEIPMEKLNEVLKKLDLFKFIETLPQGLDTYLLSNGNFMAPEIINKILFARAVVGNPSIILADASWQLLYETDRTSIHDQLFQSTPESTFVACVTDREMLHLFDQLAVVDNGRIILLGKRAEVVSQINIERYCHV